MTKPKTIKDLKRAYEQAVKDHIETFSIDGFYFFTPYAKYLLEYLEMIKIPDVTPLNSILKKGETAN